MDRAQIDSESVIVRYLSDRLSQADEEEFEAYCEQHPEIFREVESVLRLQEGLAALRDRRELAPLLTTSKQRPYWALAAGILTAALLLFWLWWQPSPTVIPLVADSPQALAGRSAAPLLVTRPYTLVRSRDRPSEATVALPASRAAIEMRILPAEFDPNARYRISLQFLGADGSQSGGSSANGLRAATDRYVIVYIDSAQLRPGHYRLELVAVRGNQPSGDAETFQLHVE